MSPLRKVARNVFNLWRNKKSRPSIDELKPCLPFLKALLVLEDKEVLDLSPMHKVRDYWLDQHYLAVMKLFLQPVLEENHRTIHEHGKFICKSNHFESPVMTIYGPGEDVICNQDELTFIYQITDAVVGEGVLEVLASLLKPFEPKFGFENHCSFLWPESKLKILNEAAWTLSNITAGNQYHIMSVVQSGCFARLVKLFYHGSVGLRVQAFWPIRDVVMGGSLEDVSSFSMAGSLFQSLAIVELLKINDEGILMALLKLIEIILKISNKIEETENEENPSENLKMLHSRCLDKVDIRWLLWAQQWFEDMEVVKELQKLRGETSFSRVKNEVDRIIAEYYPDVVSILIDEINREIAAQGEKVEDLKSKKVDEAIIDSEVEALLALKREFKALIGTDRKPTTAPVVTAVKPVDQISSEIAAQVDKVDKEMKKLLHLKSKFMVLTGADWKPATALPVSRVMTPVKDNGKANDEKELLKKPQEQEYSFLISGTLPTPK
ncbi:importin subunit alpha-1-like isoform X1 [Artemia franciscana]|uniref:importin subunit alpha-1-like isoform X1 n=1 Tax=Artemia franciscana TaxID=6661 RepID=UPI0032D9D9E1